MVRRLKPSQEQITRAIRAALEAGLRIKKINSIDGTIVVEGDRADRCPTSAPTSNEDKSSDEPDWSDE
jgi:hypothetical protein